MQVQAAKLQAAESVAQLQIGRKMLHKHDHDDDDKHDHEDDHHKGDDHHNKKDKHKHEKDGKTKKKGPKSEVTQHPRIAFGVSSTHTHSSSPGLRVFSLRLCRKPAAHGAVHSLKSKHWCRKVEFNLKLLSITTAVRYN